MPHVVAGREHGFLVVIAQGRAVRLHIPDCPKIVHPAFARGHVVGLGFAEAAGEGKLAIIIEGLIGEQYERIGVDCVANFFHHGLIQWGSEVDPCDPYAKFFVQRLCLK